MLYVRAEADFAIADHLDPFAELCRDSKEYQGHGWGCALLAGGEWRLYHDLRPVWEDDRRRFGETTCLVAHARSAFENRDIRIENNMPFHDGRFVFAFNGELRGVRIREQGRTGAEKVFRFVKRFDRGDMLAALRRALPIIERRTKRLRALNLLIEDRERTWLATRFSEDPDYFTVHEKRTGGTLAVCSQPYPGERDWQPVPEGTIRSYP